MKPLYTISKSAAVGNQDNCKCVARIYKDKIVVKAPCIKCCGLAVFYSVVAKIILDQLLISYVLEDMATGNIDSAWAHLGDYMEDDYTAA